jgi:hypothetical protein
MNDDALMAGIYESMVDLLGLSTDPFDPKSPKALTDALALALIRPEKRAKAVLESATDWPLHIVIRYLVTHSPIYVRPTGWGTYVPGSSRWNTPDTLVTTFDWLIDNGRDDLVQDAMLWGETQWAVGLYAGDDLLGRYKVSQSSTMFSYGYVRDASVPSGTRSQIIDDDSIYRTIVVTHRDTDADYSVYSIDTVKQILVKTAHSPVYNCSWIDIIH